MSRQLFLAIKLIAIFYISNSKCTGAQLWNSQTGFKLKKKHYSVWSCDAKAWFPFTANSTTTTQKTKKTKRLCAWSVILPTNRFVLAQNWSLSWSNLALWKPGLKPGFHHTTNTTTTTQKQSDFKVEQSSFTLIASF